MAAYAWTPSALTWLRVNHLINGLHKQISCKNCLYAVNSYFTIADCGAICNEHYTGNMPVEMERLLQSYIPIADSSNVSNK